MNEKELYQQSVLQNLADDESILAMARSTASKTSSPERDFAAKPVRRANRVRRLAAWGMTALALVLILTIAIPLGVRALAKLPSVAAVPGEPTPVPKAKPAVVTYVSDEPIWQEIAADFDVTVGAPLYNEETLTLLLDFHGLSGLSVYEEGVDFGCTPDMEGYGLTVKTVSPENVWYYLGDQESDEPYRTGKRIYRTSAYNHLIAVLPDGSTLNGWISAPLDDAMLPQLDFDLSDAPASGLDPDAFNAQTRAWLSENGLLAYAELSVRVSGGQAEADPIERLRRLADENGIVNAALVYEAQELRFTAGKEYPDHEVMLSANLGTVALDVNLCGKNPPRHIIRGQREPVQWSGFAAYAGQAGARPVRYQADTAGVTMRAAQGAYFSLIGPIGFSAQVELPDSWSEAQAEAFMQSLAFTIEADGVPLEKLAYPTITHTSKNIYSLRLGPLLALAMHGVSSLETVRLLPTLSDGTTETTYPDFALTFTVE